MAVRWSTVWVIWARSPAGGRTLLNTELFESRAAAERWLAEDPTPAGELVGAKIQQLADVPPTDADVASRDWIRQQLVRLRQT